MNDAQSNYLKIAVFELDEIKSHIDSQFNHKKLYFVKKEYLSSKKKLSAGLITRYKYKKIENLYQKAMRAPHDIKSGYKLFDKEFKNFILNIEDIKLWNESELIEKARVNNKKLKALKEKTTAQKYASSWLDDVETNVYVAKKRYTFIDREDTLLGAQMSMPLEIKNSDKLQKVNQHISNLKARSEEILMAKKVHYHYSNFLMHQNGIKDKIALLKEFSPQSALDRAKELEMQQDIWTFRCEALKDLLRLQFLTGIKLL